MSLFPNQDDVRGQLTIAMMMMQNAMVSGNTVKVVCGLDMAIDLSKELGPDFDQRAQLDEALIDTIKTVIEKVAEHKAEYAKASEELGELVDLFEFCKPYATPKQLVALGKSIKSVTQTLKEIEHESKHLNSHWDDIVKSDLYKSAIQ